MSATIAVDNNKSPVIGKRPIAVPLSYIACAKRLGLKKLLTILLIDSKALRIFIMNFLLTYNLRSGVSLVLRLLTVVRQDPKSVFSLRHLLDEANFRVTEEAVRTGLAVALFTSIYKALIFFLGNFNFYRYYLAAKEISRSITGKSIEVKNKHQVKKEKWHSIVAGFFAGISLSTMDESWHRGTGLYMASRLVQCIYNYNKAHGYFHFWGSDWDHGDSLLFAIASAQILYAYVMRPETLPPSYHRFIVSQGPVEYPTLDVVQKSCRGQPFNLPKYLEYIVKRAGGNERIMKNMLPYFFKVKPGPALDSLVQNINLQDPTDIIEKLPVRESIRMIPLQGLHPYTEHILLHTFNAWKKVAMKIFPVYLTLALVPAVVLRFNIFIKAPVQVLMKSLLSATQSSMFLSLFCGSYQAFVAVERFFHERSFLAELANAHTMEEIAAIVPHDNKYIYWISGLLASWSILLEKPNRRVELALYALPRAVDSFYLILNHRKLAFSVRHGELLVFCVSMGGIMFFYENYNKMLSPMISSLLKRFLSNDIVFRDHEQHEEFDDFDAFSSTSDMDGDLADGASADMMRAVSTTSLPGSVILP